MGRGSIALCSSIRIIIDVDIMLLVGLCSLGEHSGTCLLSGLPGLPVGPVGQTNGLADLSLDHLEQTLRDVCPLKGLMT